MQVNTPHAYRTNSLTVASNCGYERWSMEWKSALEENQTSRVHFDEKFESFISGNPKFSICQNHLFKLMPPRVICWPHHWSHIERLLKKPYRSNHLHLRPAFHEFKSNTCILNPVDDVVLTMVKYCRVWHWWSLHWICTQWSLLVEEDCKESSHSLLVLGGWQQNWVKQRRSIWK